MGVGGHLLFFLHLDYDGAMQRQNESEQLGRRMDQRGLFSNTRSKIKVEILKADPANTIGLALQFQRQSFSLAIVPREV